MSDDDLNPDAPNADDLSHDELSHEQLNGLLSMIDRPGPVPDDAQARVWARVAEDLKPIGERPGASQPVGPGWSEPEKPMVPVGSDDATVVRFDSVRSTKHTDLRSRVLLVTAVAAAVVAAFILIPAGDDDIDVATDEQLPPTDGGEDATPTSIDTAQACLRFVDEIGPLTDLEDLLDGPASVAARQLDEAADAVSRLRADLPIDAEPGWDGELAQIAGGLRQAAAHVRASELDQARDAFDFAERTYLDSPLAESTCLG